MEDSHLIGAFCPRLARAAKKAAVAKLEQTTDQLSLLERYAGMFASATTCVQFSICCAAFDAAPAVKKEKDESGAKSHPMVAPLAHAMHHSESWWIRAAATVALSEICTKNQLRPHSMFPELRDGFRAQPGEQRLLAQLYWVHQDLFHQNGVDQECCADGEHDPARIAQLLDQQLALVWILNWVSPLFSSPTVTIATPVFDRIAASTSDETLAKLCESCSRAMGRRAESARKQYSLGDLIEAVPERPVWKTLHVQLPADQGQPTPLPLSAPEFSLTALTARIGDALDMVTEVVVRPAEAAMA